MSSLPIKHQCFWCRCGLYRHEVTRDHLIPVFCDGGNNSNVVDSCRKCNNWRGIIPGYVGHRRQLVQEMAKWGSLAMYQRLKIANNRRGLVKHYPVVLQKQREIVNLEMLRLGFSPSVEIILLPPPALPHHEMTDLIEKCDSSIAL